MNSFKNSCLGLVAVILLCPFSQLHKAQQRKPAHDKSRPDRLDPCKLFRLY